MTSIVIILIIIIIIIITPTTTTLLIKPLRCMFRITTSNINSRFQVTLALQLIDRRPGTKKVTTAEIFEKVAVLYSRLFHATDASNQANKEFGDSLPDTVKQVCLRLERDEAMP